MTWHKKTLGTGLDVYHDLNCIQRRREEMYLEGKVFVAEPAFTSVDKVTGHVTLYFSPEESALAEELGAQACLKPDVSKLKIIDLRFLQP